MDLLRAAGADVVLLQPDPDAPVDRAALLDEVAAADVLLALLTERIDADVLRRGERLRGIANFAVGYNNIDVAEATRLGIPVSNTPGVLTEATADLTWALLLAVARRVPEADTYTRAGRFRIWGPELLLGSDVGPGADGVRRTLGIIGFGRIGEAVARRARGFDMEVLAYSPHSRSRIVASADAHWAELDEVIERSDFLTLHAALTPDTRHLIGEAELRRMKATSYLVNVARGEIVDERALVRALREGWIAGAALDVYEHEPEMAAGLADCASTVLVPHIGSATHGTRDRMATMAATNAIAHLNGTAAPDAVNPDAYESAAWQRRVQQVAP
jgi:glyoxylate reductase